MRLDLPAGLRRAHECLVPVRWGDMDALGHVNNTLYFRFMESARIDWLQAQGWMHPGLAQGPLIVNAFCNFLQQVEFPSTLRLVTSIGAVGRTSFDTYVVMTPDGRGGDPVATGGATVVWVDYATGRPLALPDGLRVKLTAQDTAAENT